MVDGVNANHQNIFVSGFNILRLFMFMLVCNSQSVSVAVRYYMPTEN